jgi:hypothetical protein
MFDKITSFLGPKVGLAQLTVKEKQPELFLAGGIGLGIFAAIKLAQAHKDSEEIFYDIAGQIEATKTGAADFNARADAHNQEVGEEQVYRLSKRDQFKTLGPLYVEAARRGAIVYGPSVLMGIGALALIVTSHRSLKARNRALMSMAALLERGFSKYRERVRDELGVEADQRFYYGAETRTVNTITVGKDGKKKKSKKEDKNHIPENVETIMYQRVFDEFNVNWAEGDELNQWFLGLAVDMYQLKLRNHGWVSLNEVLDHLGFEKTGYGQVVGWSLKDDGDHYIDFGLDDDINQRESERRIFLNFNVSGNILPYIEED